MSARTAAAGAGGFTPLHEQDVARWDGRRIDEAEALLFEASRLGMPGRYQIEAAIQSVHCSRRITGQVDHAAIERLYDTLLATAKTVTVCAGRFPGWRGGDPMNDDALTLMVLPTVTGPIARPVGANAASQSSDTTSCAASSRLTGAAGSVAPSWRIG